MKVGILTFHAGMNHGAYLQAWSSCEFLRQAGVDAAVIDYQNRTHFWQEHRGLLLRYDPRNLWGNLRKILAFRRARARLPRTPPISTVAQISRLPLDAVVVGSDIVWNFELPWLGRDPIYFGVGLERFRRIAYAASFGPLRPESPLPGPLRAGLEGFQSLSVRDEFSRAYLERELGRTAELVVDPTLLIDRPSREPRPSSMPSPYLLVYAYALRESEVAEAQAFAHEHGLETVAVGYPQRWCDRSWLSADPFEWVACFQHADAVLTSTFHGSLFALKYGKPFVASSNTSIRDKTVAFLSALGLGNRISTGAEPIRALLETPLDVPSVTAALKPLMDRSRDYLLRSLR
jgi:hypothetical protein